LKVMVVDDELVSRIKLARILSDLGVCHQFDSGKEAISVFEKALVEKQPYQLVTLDISMPDTDGLEVLNRFRQLENDYDVPDEKKTKIVMVTSQTERDSILSAIAESCSDYIIKPFERVKIAERLKRLGIDL